MGYGHAEWNELGGEVRGLENGTEVYGQACGNLGGHAGGCKHAPPMLDNKLDAGFPKVAMLGREGDRVSLATASMRTRSRTELAVASVVKADCT